MDLEEGADDQYYDYSPSQVEAIIYAIPQLTLEHQDYTIEGLKTHLRNFIANEENDEDMISQYSDTLESLENTNQITEKRNYSLGFTFQKQSINSNQLW